MATQLPDNLINAIASYLEGTATPKEKEQVNRWYSSFNDEDVEIPSNSLDMKDQVDSRLRLRLKEAMDHSDEKEIKIYPLRSTWILRIASVAAVIFIISTGAYFFMQRSADLKAVKMPNPIKEGISRPADKVMLTLQDGSEISLSDAAIGEVIRQTGFTISKIADGKFEYDLLNSQNVKGSISASNKIETPIGSQIQIRFPDGSQVWINASSSLQFPINFSDNDFDTDLNGEAYFEVTPNKSRKFRVKSGRQVTEVLGTRFNIQAYLNEPSIITTLFEGSIRITDPGNNNSQLLKPGQQARLSKTFQVTDSDASQAIAWTEGYFHFNNAGIKTVMHELERWYDIRVRYEGELTKQKFEGSIDKKLTIQQVLAILGKSQVHFRINGKELVVMP
ncbi:FecR protein [Daejeonella rubra]|uniref:FecR protein n=1 Tax=Daejeonella rubra TaxID=990371 RepID=A0A1G9T5Y3_9SPHI|nr:FecR family protein [Daejeonella rubra]SDM43048.1 FecR protein [Daejeonella rubra]